MEVKYVILPEADVKIYMYMHMHMVTELLVASPTPFDLWTKQSLA